MSTTRSAHSRKNLSDDGILTHVQSWPVEDRLRLMEQIWDGLLNQGHDPGLTEGQKAEIDRRLAEDDAAPDDVVSWDEVKAQALKRAGRLKKEDQQLYDKTQKIQ